jgi:RNA polymerase sigma-70 factor (ECF subfamily)
MKEFVNYSDEELMLEVKADNMFAFDCLYRKYGKRIYRFALSILKSSEEAENIIQEVFLSLWEHRHSVINEASVKYYIFSIAYNSSISVLRKKIRETSFIDHLKSLQDIQQEVVNTELEFNELNDKLNQIIDQLPQRQREVFLLHRIERLKYRDISERLGISVNTIENHMSKALKTIRKKLGNYSVVAILFCSLFV